MTDIVRIRNGWTTLAGFLFDQGIARSHTERINQLSKDIDAFHAAADKLKEKM